MLGSQETSSPLTPWRRAALLLGLSVSTLLMLSSCSSRHDAYRIYSAGDALAANQVTVEASFLPGSPLLQSWAVLHHAPFIMPASLTDLRRIEFEVGSRSPWLVTFNNWAGAPAPDPPATITVSRARWSLKAVNDRGEAIAASRELTPDVDLVLAGVCQDSVCPYEFAKAELANDWLAFTITNGDLPELRSEWLHPGDEVKISVHLAVWLASHRASSEDLGADYLTVKFRLASRGTNVMIAAR